MSTRAWIAGTALVVAASTFAQVAVAADPFTYEPPGQLVSGSGKGRVDNKIYAPTMRFPMESGPAYANSQVWGHGGNSGPGGGQCDKENFSYPWHDNYCESRSWDMPLCPSGNGHQGQDIRAASCVKGVHWVVAAVDGTITNIGSYSVYLTAADGTRYDYLHMQDVTVKVGQKVKREERLGKVSNQFNGEATTVHLHFNIRQNVAGVGSVYVPTYLSLVESYETLLGLNPIDAGAPDAPPPKPPVVAEAPVTDTSPTEPPPPEAAAEDTEGCTFSPTAPLRSGSSSLAAIALLAGALGLIAARRRR
jgi:murein DD-endopeptidase MepM/ murein hydrolase activator NlpD